MEFGQGLEKQYLLLHNVPLGLANRDSIDHSSFKQTFELGIFISTAGKSILNLVML